MDSVKTRVRSTACKSHSVSFIALAMTAALFGAGTAQARDIVLRLDRAVTGDKPLELHLACRGDRVIGAFGLAPGFNSRPHDVDATNIEIRPHGLIGIVNVTLNPDQWVPEDGKPVLCAYAIQADITSNSVTGRYDGVCGKIIHVGHVSGNEATAAAPAYRHVRLRMFAPLLRLRLANGPNASYALDMNLDFDLRGTEPTGVRFETVVPDYRGYSAQVQRHSIRLNGERLAGDLEVLVDYGGQGRAGNAAAPELHVFRMDGLVVGGRVAGRYNTSVGELSAKGDFFVGEVSSRPPPAPTKSMAWMRLHGAMRNGYPVLLDVSLADDGRLNGLAWTPRYNHQPQTLDAAGLTLKGSTIGGDVIVTVVPDCYKPPETFTLRYTVDATITDSCIHGTFKGKDGDESHEGPITGGIRPKKAPAVTRETIASCRLNLGYALDALAMPKKGWKKKEARPHNLSLELTYRDGELSRAVAVNSFDPEVLCVPLDAAEISIQGDSLTGSFAFSVTNGPVLAGRYSYEVEGVLDGDHVTAGFWRGKRDEKPILTKSAKMGGVVVPRTAGQPIAR